MESGRPRKPSESLERIWRICLCAMVLAVVLVVVTVPASPTMSRGRQPLAVSQEFAEAIWLLMAVVFAGSVAWLEALAGGGTIGVLAVFIFSAACPPFLGVPLAIMVSARLKARIEHLRSLEVLAASGLCPACGYDLAGLPRDAVCPECGGSTGIGAGSQRP